MRVVSHSSRSVEVAAICPTDSSYLELRLARFDLDTYAAAVILRPFLFAETACASYLFGCLTASKLAVVDPREALVDDYLSKAERVGAPIVAVFETHVQADHVSGLPALVEATGATPYLPAGAGVEFPHEALRDGDEVELGNTRVRALATPGHAPAHHAYVVSDLRRGTDEPWLVFTGDSLLVGDVGRPDLHAGGDPLPLARQLHGSLERLLELPDGVSVYPSHYAGSVCGRTLSGNPFSTIGFERRHNPALAAEDAEAFAQSLLVDVPPPPADQAKIVAANRRGALPVSP
jgi:hydroxyacylglutathione hydrolase